MISATNLTIKFGSQTIIKSLNFEINKGEKVSVTGESGSGKTSLMNSLLGFVIPDSGEIKIFNKILNEKNISEIRSSISWVPQEVNFSVNNAKEFIYLPFTFKHNRNIKPEQNEIVELMNEFGLNKSLLDKNINDLSGGEKQRIVLITNLLLKREILFLDEATSALDKNSKQIVTDYFYKQNDLTILAVTHDEELIKRSNNIIELNKIK